MGFILITLACLDAGKADSRYIPVLSICADGLSVLQAPLLYGAFNVATDLAEGFRTWVNDSSVQSSSIIAGLFQA